MTFNAQFKKHRLTLRYVENAYLRHTWGSDDVVLLCIPVNAWSRTFTLHRLGTVMKVLSQCLECRSAPRSRHVLAILVWCEREFVVDHRRSVRLYFLEIAPATFPSKWGNPVKNTFHVLVVGMWIPVNVLASEVIKFVFRFSSTAGQLPVSSVGTCHDSLIKSAFRCGLWLGWLWLTIRPRVNWHYILCVHGYT